mmetsp:Transcript_60669/g.70350  ORF Transcript_60669/g.70350 Transcript_60669/m.70350 type:complete len:361 (+) Transcript_60669:1067-2149(+)
MVDSGGGGGARRLHALAISSPRRDTASSTTSAGFACRGNSMPNVVCRYASTSRRRPWNAVRPPGAMIRISSSAFQISARGWFTDIATVRSVSSATLRSVFISSSAVFESRPFVGSSRNMARGAATSSTAIDARLRCPPLTPRDSASPIGTSATCESPSARSVIDTTACRSAFVHSGGSRSSAAYDTLRYTVSSVCSTSSCGTDPIIERYLVMLQSPLMLTVPVASQFASYRPSSACSSTVLPDPDGPRIAVTVPGRSEPLTADSSDFFWSRSVMLRSSKSIRRGFVEPFDSAKQRPRSAGPWSSSEDGMITRRYTVSATGMHAPRITRNTMPRIVIGLSEPAEHVDPAGHGNGAACPRGQ